MLPCSNIITIHQDNLHCDNCERGYVIYQQEHTCNDPLIKCGADHISLIEKYTTIETPLDNINILNCNKCKEKLKKESAPKLTTCPSCQYRGYYKHNGNKLCLVCVKPVESITPTKYIEENLIMVVDPVKHKKNMKLFLNVDDGGYIPGNERVEAGFYIKINIYGVGVDAGILLWNNEIKKMVFIFNNDTTVSQFQSSMCELSAFIHEISQEYYFNWNETSSIKFEWLKYLYNTYGREDKVNIT